MKNDVQVERNVSIAEILGVPHSKRRIAIRCPFHQDSTPSFILYPDNSYHCFGCSQHGKNAVDFVMGLGYTFKQALEELRPYCHTPYPQQ